MSSPHEQIPNAPGRHRGDTSEHASGMSVRAQNPPLEERSGETPYHFQLSHHAGRGQYRIRAWAVDDESPTDEPGYAEEGRYDGLAQALEDLPQQQRYVVLENTDTGRVFLGRESNLSDNWAGGGEFDQATVFATEDEAAAYADQRQREMDG